MEKTNLHVQVGFDKCFGGESSTFKMLNLSETNTG